MEMTANAYPGRKPNRADDKTCPSSSSIFEQLK